MGLTSCCLYGGAPYHAQEFKLKKGIDVVIGTPGRIKVSHLQKVSVLENRILT